MTKSGKQAELLRLFGETRNVIQTFVESRGEADKMEIGTPTAWSAKDLLANVACWMEYMVDRMMYFERGQTPPRNVDFGAVNQRAYEAFRHRAWGEVVAYAERSLNGLIEKTRQFSDEMLEVNNAYGDDPGGPLWGEVSANGFIYSLQEFEKFYRRKGDVLRADAVSALLRKETGEPTKIVTDLITPQTLSEQQMANASPFVIDVRGAKEYEAGHVRGAVNIPLSDLSKKLKKIPVDRPVVTYCNMHHPGESRGERAAALLTEKGYKVAALQGGFPAWKDAALPVETAHGEKS